jgi:hypothetical protein
MKRLLRLQSKLLKEIDKYEKVVPERDKFIDWERVHMASSARLGYLMAEARGVDPETKGPCGSRLSAGQGISEGYRPILRRGDRNHRRRREKPQ